MDSSSPAEKMLAIMNQVFVSTLVSDRLSQLLPRPLRARMGGDVIMNQPAAVMFDDDERV